MIIPCARRTCFKIDRKLSVAGRAFTLDAHVKAGKEMMDIEKLSDAELDEKYTGMRGDCDDEEGEAKA
jgi:hypothetical protein